MFNTLGLQAFVPSNFHAARFLFCVLCSSICSEQAFHSSVSHACFCNWPVCSGLLFLVRTKSHPALQMALANKDRELHALRTAHHATHARLTALETQAAADPTHLSIADAAKLRQDNAAYIDELVEATEALHITKRSLEAATAMCGTLRGELQTFADQRNILYREHVREVTKLREEVQRATADRDDVAAKVEAAEAEASELREQLKRKDGEDNVKQGALERVMLKLRLDRVRLVVVLLCTPPLCGTGLLALSFIRCVLDAEIVLAWAVVCTGRQIPEAGPANACRPARTWRVRSRLRQPPTKAKLTWLGSCKSCLPRRARA